MKRMIAVFTAFASLSLGTLVLTAATDIASAVHDDAQLRAMVDEIGRAKALQLNDLDKAYFVQYATSDASLTEIIASLGGLISSNQLRLRHPTIEVRVGDYTFDNTDSVYSRTGRQGMLPIDDDYAVIRSHFWLSTDEVYKAATDQITRKRNALRDIAEPERIPDFATAQPVQVIEKVRIDKPDTRHWEDALRSLSECFTSHSSVTGSSLRLQLVSSAYRIVNSEGTIVRIPQELAELSIMASGLAKDGNRVWNHDFLTGLKGSDFPDPAQLKEHVENVAAETEALIKAPVTKEYTGPVLFEGEAAAEMMAQVLADAVRLDRKPIAPPGMSNPAPQMVDSVWSSKLGQKVTPEWMTLVDDPHESKYGSVTLAGNYDVDDEGVPAKRVTLVDKGVLRNYLSSRRPVGTIRASNGHGRLPGAYSGEAAVIGNLFVQVDHPLPESDMKSKLLEQVKAAGLTYGLTIRRIDFPSTANLQELKAVALLAQKNGYARTLNSPILAYRVYLDGHEELVRGLRFKEFSAKELRTVDAASDHPYVFNYVNNGSSFNLVAASTEATTSSVICPSLLLDYAELGRSENDEAGKLPLVPPPPLVVHH
ncbi:MAG: hypothetical protein JO108_29180 [Acidobacteriaceae bacterium]|nr:hypothetical protein [Acidobacteriaceae bacterium]